MSHCFLLLLLISSFLTLSNKIQLWSQSFTLIFKHNCLWSSWLLLLFNNNNNNNILKNNNNNNNNIFGFLLCDVFNDRWKKAMATILNCAIISCRNGCCLSTAAAVKAQGYLKKWVCTWMILSCGLRPALCAGESSSTALMNWPGLDFSLCRLKP